MISPYKIKWLNRTSLDFDCWTELSFESGDEGECESFLNREGVFSESFDGNARRVHSYKHTEVMSPKLTFIKQNYEEFTDTENQAMLSWLDGSNKASVLSVYKDDSNVISYELIGNFTEIQLYKLSNKRIAGYTATFEANTPYALSPIKTIEKVITEPATFTINCQTDDYEGLVYPKITIVEDNSIIVNIDSTMASNIFTDGNYIEGTVYSYDNTYYWKDADGNHTSQNNTSEIETTSVYIKNETANISTFIKNNQRNESIIIDGANKLITNGGTRIFANDFAWNWVPLMRGNNEITVIGNCSIALEYREPIKCGEF